MSALDTAPPIDPSESPRPDSAEVTGWLLEGRWFTIDLEGRITSWSPAAAERFGYGRREISGSDFVASLVAEGDHAAAGAAVAQAMSGAAGEAGYTGELDSVANGGASLRAAFALVPI